MSDRELFEQIGRDKLLWMYEMMVRARRFDERLLPLVTGFYHSGIGQEAVGVGICASLRRDDYIMYDHRGCTQMIAKGLPVEKIYADFLGKVTGTCKGKGAGIVHIADPSIGILGQSGTLGGCFPIAFGAAFSSQHQGLDRVVVCFYGDGTASRGTFHESLVWAAARKVPLVLVCENNKYGVSVRYDTVTPGRLAERGLGFGVPGEKVDGQDVVAVFQVGQKAIEHARSGKGPYIIEADTYRFRGHFEGDDQSYRPAEEVESWKKRDPIRLLESRLLEAETATESELQKIRDMIEAEIDQAIKNAQDAPLPEPSAIYDDVYA